MADLKLPRAAPFYLPYIVPVITIITQYTARSWHALLAPSFVWVVIPLLDVTVGCRNRQPRRLTADQRRELEERRSFKAAVLFWCPMQFSMLCWSVKRVTDADVDALRLFGLLASMGLIAAEGINCSHELLHRPSNRDALTAQLLLVSVCYGHFYIEHARGHHKRVATPDDPATMLYGESFYQFLPRTVFGGYRSAWRLEVKRLAATGQSVWSLHNAMLWYLASPVALFIIPIWIVRGGRGVLFFFAQAFVAVALLEQVNAIEHYGLERKQLANGSYENVGPQHSWDAPYTVSNHLMFMLQRHSDHHLNAGKRYQSLEASPESPQLPAGYLTLAPCLLVPPLWRAVMDPVLSRYHDAHRKKT